MGYFLFNFLVILMFFFLGMANSYGGEKLKSKRSKLWATTAKERVVTTKIYVYEDPETGERIFSNLPMNQEYKPFMVIATRRPVAKIITGGGFPGIEENGLVSFNFSSKFEDIFREVAQKYQLDPKLLYAIAKVESNFNPQAVSPKGALGVMQLIPSTAKLVGVENPFDPAENIHGGAKYLKYLLERFGDLRLALAAYNAGPKAVEAYRGIPPYQETQRYVDLVLALYQKLKGEGN